MKTQLMIQRNPKVKRVEIIHVSHQIKNDFGGADYIGFDNNREFSWTEQYGNEAIFGFRDKQNRLQHLPCETKDKAAMLRN